MLRILRKHHPAFSLDVNARHRGPGHRTSNPAGKIINNLITRGGSSHIDTNFNTFLGKGHSGMPDSTLTNGNNIINTVVKAVGISSSDHTLIMLTIVKTPILVPGPRSFRFNHANWEGFQTDFKANTTINLNNQPIIVIENNQFGK